MNALRHRDMTVIAADPRRARRRILFVINSLAGGGAERVMTTLLSNSEDQLSRNEIALAVLDRAPPAFAFPDWLKIFQLDCEGGTLSSISAIDAVVREFDPHATVSFLTRANLASGIAMMRRGRPWIISERTSTPAHLGSHARRLVTRAMMRCIYPRATSVIAVSDGVAAKLEQGFAVPAERLDVIPNPVDAAALIAAAREKNPLASEKPYIIGVGRLVSIKNYAMLIEAFAKSNLPCRLAIAGDGPERAALQGLASKRGVADRVIFPGWLSNPYPVLAGARVFALSSDVEGFPNALVEALALGVPAVATNCPDGPAEILARCSVPDISSLTVAEAGIVTPVGDADSFAEALRLAFHETTRKVLIVAGRKRAGDYSAATIAGRYWSVIDRVLEQAAAPAAI